MTPTSASKTILFFVMFLLSALSAKAVELTLKADATCPGGLVRLGDLVETHGEASAELRRLLSVELFATPSTGQRRIVRAKEVRELLELRGLDVGTLTFRGADVIEIYPAGASRDTAAASAVQEAAAAKKQLVVATVLKTILPGDTIRQGDVELKTISRLNKGFQYAMRIEDVLGREATRQLEPAQPIDVRWLRQPMQVHRNETITVISRAAGVQVRTSAKALEDGALGDSILVEELEGKKRQRFSARVSAYQQAEIFAGVTNIVSNQPASATR